MNTAVNLKILTAALAAKVPIPDSKALISTLASKAETFALASQFDSPWLKRELSLAKPNRTIEVSLQLEFDGHKAIYQSQEIGKVQILYKSPLPGELQARLATESAIDRFLEYLQKLYQIVVLDESDRHVKVFIPKHEEEILSFAELWKKFIREIAFSAYGDTKHQLPGLVQTFIQMLNSVTLSGRGFSTLDVPILTKEQSNVLAAWYYAVIRDVEERQNKRQRQIDALEKELAESDLDEKTRKSKTKDLQDKKVMQIKEAEKYTDYFRKSFGKSLEEQNAAWQELEQIEAQLSEAKLTKSEHKKLQKQQEKLRVRVVFTPESIQQKLQIFHESEGRPFEFIKQDEKNNPNKFSVLRRIAKNFTKTATDQINSTRGDIFTQCIFEMYRLLEENKPNDPLPQPLLTEEAILGEMRSPGDDSKEFCYSCGIKLDPKTARWQVLRFMFERPSQRRQSASSEGRPHICSSCSALAFASPLKVTEESVVLMLESGDNTTNFEVKKLKIKDYLIMLTNKEMHLSAGRYLILNSNEDKTSTGDLASQKMGQLQYAIVKIAKIFPVEVLADFKFSLITQGSERIILNNKHLIFIKGLMDSYGQQIVNAGKEVNMMLGNAVRYIQQDLPYLADYTLIKVASISNKYQLEQIREMYWQAIQNDLKTKGLDMESDKQPAPKAKLYIDIAALTGITCAFAQSLEITARQANKGEDYVEREVSKLIEKVYDAVAFCYYATLGDETKRSVQARLYSNTENYFIYNQAKNLLDKLELTNREMQDEKGKSYLILYADDILNIYQHFKNNGYSQEKQWKDLTYQLKLSLYTRFPELVRKQKSAGDK
ncbi:hypothetical protein A6770_36090 [Nostoc minutum NIES-26]|uniref:Uncharacterized protein n=1 Tax=Nostoc minutum NIES-26 TaxID=1844469 RepID=A0A367RZB6_9NOSO|nr:hypothetical protein A6770_36090 [Nostoc minutum NIES-26]